MIRRIAFAVAGLCLLAATAALAQTVGYVVTGQVKVTPNSGAYSAGYCLGGVLTVPKMIRPNGPGGTTLRAVTFLDPAAQSGTNDAMNLFVFNKAPTGTYTDHATCHIGTPDYVNLIGSLAIAASNCVQDGTPATVTTCTIQPALPLAAGTLPVTSDSIWVVPILAAAPTYGTPQTLYFTFGSTPN